MDTLAHLLTGPSDEPALILRAAEALARHGDPRAADALAAIAATERLTRPERLQAGRALLSLSDPRGEDVLYALAGDPAAGTRLRLQAAEALDGVQDSRALYALTVIALHPSAPRASQIQAAERLDQFRTRKAADALLSVLDNPELLEEMRVRASTLWRTSATAGHAAAWSGSPGRRSVRRRGSAPPARWARSPRRTGAGHWRSC